MTAPGRYPSPRLVADRVLDVVTAELAPRFAAALVRHLSAAHDLAVTEEETDDVARQLMSASAGRPAAELDVIAVQLLARHRSTAAAAEAERDTLGTLGERGRPAAAGRAASTRLPGPSAAPAVSLGATGTASAGRPSRCDEPCAVAGVVVAVPDIHDVDDLSSDEDVLAAAALATVYQAGDRMGVFRAVDAAVRQLDSTENELCIDDADLLNALSCWHEVHYRVRKPERAKLVAKILGLSDPDLPDGVVPDPYIQPMLSDLIEAISAACDPASCGRDPQAVQRAAQFARTRISSSMSRGAIMKIAQLQVQFELAQDILIGLAPFVHGHCRPGSGSTSQTGGESSEWVAVTALLGDLLPDGTDVLRAHATATAWRTVLTWLAEPACIDAGVDDDLCAAAAVLRPRQHGRWRCCDEPGKCACK